MSKKFTLINEDFKKIFKGFLIALGGALIVFLGDLTKVIDFSSFGQYSNIAILVSTAICSSLVNMIQKWISVTQY